MPKSRKSTHIFPKLLEFETDVKNLLDEFLINEDMEALGALFFRTFVNSFPEVKIQYHVMEIMGSADYAYVRGAFTVTSPADTLLDKGKFLSVWKKFPNDKWLLTHDIFSSDLPIPGAQNMDWKNDIASNVIQ